MSNSKIIALLIIAVSLFSCRKPKPLDIEIPQAESKMVISSMVVNDHAIAVSAGYTVGTALDLQTATEDSSLPKDAFIDSAIVTISSPGQAPMELIRVERGLYTTNDVNLVAGSTYTLTVTDPKKNITSVATTTYIPNDKPVDVTSEFSTVNGDSILKINVTVDSANSDDRYFVSYGSLSQLRATTSIKDHDTKSKLKALASFEPKRIQLIDNNMLKQDKLEHSFSVKAAIKDTMIIQVAHIDQPYYKYLTAYKRTGYFINQITGEPIDLPTNIKTGYGYFSLFQTKSFILDVATGNYIEMSKDDILDRLIIK